MQTPVIAPPAPPPASQPGSPSGSAIATTVQPVPVALPSIAFLRARGSELSRQLTSASSRRDETARDYRRASEASRPGIQARLDVLDERIVQLEKDIALNGQQLAQAGGRGAEAITVQPPGNGPMGLGPGNITAISVVFTIFVLAPIAMSMARLIWKRGTRIGKAPTTNPESELRLQRVEQGVDAIAVEVERISEGQRFVTQLMANNEKLNAIGGARAEPVPVSARRDGTG